MQRIVYWLQYHKGKELINELTNKLCDKVKNESHNNRIFAEEFLGIIGENKSVKTLLAALDRKNIEGTHIRFYYGEKCIIIEALGKIGDPLAVPALLKYLGQKPTVEALLKINDLSAVSGICSIMKSNDWLFKYHNLNILSEYNCELATEVINSLRHDKDKQAQNLVVQIDELRK